MMKMLIHDDVKYDTARYTSHRRTHDKYINMYVIEDVLTKTLLLEYGYYRGSGMLSLMWLVGDLNYDQYLYLREIKWYLKDEQTPDDPNLY